MASPQLENGYTRIANELLERIAQTQLSGREYRVVLFVLRKTYGYGKKKDRIALSQFVKGTLIDRSSICQIIKKLVVQKLLVKEKSLYGINKNWEEWVVVRTPLVVNSPLPSGNGTTKTSGNGTTYKRKKETNTKEITRFAGKPMRKNKFGSYKEDSHSDSFEESIDIETGDRARSLPKDIGSKALYLWAEERMGRKFVNPPKQFTFIKKMTVAGYPIEEIKKCWEAMESDPFWSSKGFDFGNVSNEISKVKLEDKPAINFNVQNNFQRKG